MSALRKLKNDQKFRRFCRDVCLQIMLRDADADPFFEALLKSYERGQRPKDVVQLIQAARSNEEAQPEAKVE